MSRSFPSFRLLASEKKRKNRTDPRMDTSIFLVVFLFLSFITIFRITRNGNLPVVHRGVKERESKGGESVGSFANGWDRAVEFFTTGKKNKERSERLIFGVTKVQLCSPRGSKFYYYYYYYYSPCASPRGTSRTFPPPPPSVIASCKPVA